MRTVFKYSFLFLILLTVTNFVCGQTQKDTMYAYLATTPVIIDGSDADACWANADWHPISNVWIPYNEIMKDGDFSGRFKLAWDSLYLYLLAEIIDDSLSDDHVDPFDNCWNDDCLELFVDEDRSKGNHERSNNAFAYHTSIYYDAMDIGPTGAWENKKHNIEMAMDTIGEHTYLWELAVKNYSAAYKLNDPEASRVYLHHNKLMGFSLAYCDNDETTSRENFIGSTYMAQAVANNNYITADYFGTLLLVDPNYQGGTAVNEIPTNEVKVYPNPAVNSITIELASSIAEKNNLEIIDLSGKSVLTLTDVKNNQKIAIQSLPQGAYAVILSTENTIFKSIFIKQ